jgi:hypothetical protein
MTLREPLAEVALATGDIHSATRSDYSIHRAEHLFTLKQNFPACQFKLQQIAECDAAIRTLIDTLAAQQPPPASELPPARHAAAPKRHTLRSSRVVAITCPRREARKQSRRPWLRAGSPTTERLNSGIVNRQPIVAALDTEILNPPPVAA